MAVTLRLAVGALLPLGLAKQVALVSSFVGVAMSILGSILVLSRNLVGLGWVSYGACLVGPPPVPGSNRVRAPSVMPMENCYDWLPSPTLSLFSKIGLELKLMQKGREISFFIKTVETFLLGNFHFNIN